VVFHPTTDPVRVESFHADGRVYLGGCTVILMVELLSILLGFLRRNKKEQTKKVLCEFQRENFEQFKQSNLVSALFATYRSFCQFHGYHPRRVAVLDLSLVVNTKRATIAQVDRGNAQTTTPAVHQQYECWGLWLQLASIDGDLPARKFEFFARTERTGSF
jgi:hypothetical protein